jgi:transposase
MANYKKYDDNQHSMVVINYLEQLQAGTFEHALHHLVDNKLDMSVFDLHYTNDNGGRAAYDPAILLKIILFAYSKGITSSREIDWSCKTNIIFKALSCDTEPHFTTIAGFVSQYPDDIETLFSQIVLVCQEEGLIGHEFLVIDGCKTPSNAAKEHSGTFKEPGDKCEKIQRQIRHLVTQQQRLDKYDTLEDDRRKRNEKTIATLNKAFDKYDKFLKTHSPRIVQG